MRCDDPPELGEPLGNLREGCEKCPHPLRLVGKWHEVLPKRLEGALRVARVWGCGGVRRSGVRFSPQVSARRGDPPYLPSDRDTGLSSPREAGTPPSPRAVVGRGLAEALGSLRAPVCARPRTSTQAPQAASYCAREAPDRGAGRCDASRALHARFCRWPPPPAPPPASRASPQAPIGRDWNRRASSHSPRPMGVGGCGGAGRGSRCGLGRAKHLVP